MGVCLSERKTPMEKDFNNFLELVKSVKEGRRQMSVIYPSQFLLVGSLLAILSGAENTQAIFDFFTRHFKSDAPKSKNTITSFFKN
jgi:hypothetical protein